MFASQQDMFPARQCNIDELKTVMKKNGMTGTYRPTVDKCEKFLLSFF